MGRNKQLNSILKSSLVKKGKKVRICCNRTRASFFFFLNQGIDGSHVCNQVKHSAAVSDLVVVPGHELQGDACLQSPSSLSKQISRNICHAFGERRIMSVRLSREGRRRKKRKKRKKREKRDREIERDGERRARARSAGTRRQHKRVTLVFALCLNLIFPFLCLSSSSFHRFTAGRIE